MRYMQRYRDIAMAFSHNGFGFIVKELGLYELLSLPKRLVVKNYQEPHPKTTGERVRLFLEELGPTYVKMGQLASTRYDLIPADIIQELEKLQDNVPAFSYDEVKDIIEQELGMEMDQIFDTFTETPLGSASIGQVHYGILKTGEHVAVKVQRPNIVKKIKTDLEILQQLAVRAEHRLEWAANYQIKAIIDEFSKAILAELDYSVEGRNADKIARQFSDNPTIYIPSIYWNYSTKKVLTMEYVQGTKLNELVEINRKGYDAKVLAERVAHSIFQQILIEGFFHGDPHPGNVAALPDDVIVFMDFGMVGRLTPDMRMHFASLVIAMMRQSTDGVIKALSLMGTLPDDVDMQNLRLDVEDLRDTYYDVPLSQISLGEAVNDLLSVANHHHIQIPTELTLVAKALITMEAMVEKLDPNISIIKIAEPFGRELLKERFHPKRLAEKLFNQWNEFEEVITDLPKQMQQLASITKKGKVPVELNIPRIEMFLTKLDRVSNRLSFSIVLLAFSIIMVGLIMGSAISGQASLLWNIPAIEIGFVIAILMFLGLLFSIFKSGRF